MLSLVLLGSLLLASVLPESGKVCPSGDVPTFEAYEVPTETVATPRIDLSSHIIGPRFRTVLTRALASNPPNLAGHYLLVEWGCGTSCSMFAIVNLRSGAIWHEPNLIVTRGIRTKVDSRLIILNPGLRPRAETTPTSFHVWQDEQLQALCQAADGLNLPANSFGRSSNPSLQRTPPGRSPGRCR